MTDHQQLRALAEAATPGPWKFDNDGYVKSCVVPEFVCSPHSCLPNRAKTGDHIKSLKHTGKFIAAANPTTILALLDENEELRRKSESVLVSIVEMYNDWKGGDFSLPKLAEHDFMAIYDAAMKENGNV